MSTCLHSSPRSSSFQELCSSRDLHLLLLRPPTLISAPEITPQRRALGNDATLMWMAFPATNKMQTEGTHLSCLLTAGLGMDCARGVAPFSPTGTPLPPAHRHSLQLSDFHSRHPTEKQNSFFQVLPSLPLPSAFFQQSQPVASISSQ